MARCAAGAAPFTAPAALSNHGAFGPLLDREYRAACLSGEPLSLAFCNIDGIYRVNEAHGESVGDRVIQAFARTLYRISGQSCVIACDGGGCFGLLFRGVPSDEAHARLNAARQDFSQRRLINRDTEIAIGRINFSGGVADAMAYGDPADAAAAALLALRQAKDQGRNRIVSASIPL